MDFYTCVQMHLHINEIKIHLSSSRGISGIQKTEFYNDRGSGILRVKMFASLSSFPKVNQI